ncbi:MAG: trans-sulfuration enzyme family protein [Acidobacteriota bacterium]
MSKSSNRKRKKEARGGTDSRAGHAWQFATRAAHVGSKVDLSAGTPTSTPIVASSAFEQPGAAAIDEVFGGDRRGYVYGRYHNPTVDALERAIADLEGSEATVAYSSGMAAIAGAFAALDLPRGAKVMAARDLYGTTIAWLEDAASKNDWELVYVDCSDRPFATSAIRKEKPAVVYAETLSNPLVRVVDLDALGPACRDTGVALVVDATFTPPSLLRPLEHNAALVLHSATKYLGGHGDLIGGVLSGSADLIECARARRRLDGTIVDPFTAWLILRGLRTLSLRVVRQCANARLVAAHLNTHHQIEKVHYPGLGHRDTPREKQLLERLFPHGDYGAMLAFEISHATASTPRLFLDALQLWGRATTLGDLGSQALVPVMTSHRHLAPERRDYMGITDGLVRLSVGIEDAADLIEDLDQALAACD